MFSSKLWLFGRISSSDFECVCQNQLAMCDRLARANKTLDRSEWESLWWRSQWWSPKGGQMCDNNGHKSHTDTCRNSWYQFTAQPRCCPTRSQWTTCTCHCRQLQPMITTREMLLFVYKRRKLVDRFVVMCEITFAVKNTWRDKCHTGNNGISI